MILSHNSSKRLPHCIPLVIPLVLYFIDLPAVFFGHAFRAELLINHVQGALIVLGFVPSKSELGVLSVAPPVQYDVERQNEHPQERREQDKRGDEKDYCSNELHALLGAFIFGVFVSDDGCELGSVPGNEIILNKRLCHIYLMHTCLF